MDLQKIRNKIKSSDYVYSLHADVERKADDLTFRQIEKALLSCEKLEDYPDTGRGESCLLVGFSDDIPIHIVCGWRADKVSIITVYVPKPPKYKDPWTRCEKHE